MPSRPTQRKWNIIFRSPIRRRPPRPELAQPTAETRPFSLVLAKRDLLTGPGYFNSLAPIGTGPLVVTAAETKRSGGTAAARSGRIAASSLGDDRTHVRLFVVLDISNRAVRRVPSGRVLGRMRSRTSRSSHEISTNLAGSRISIPWVVIVRQVRLVHHSPTRDATASPGPKTYPAHVP